MSPTIAVLIWVLLIAAVIISVLSTIVSICFGFDEQEIKFVLLGILGIFITVIIGWGIWAIYPYTLL
jgi:hypothetical protein